MTYFTVLHWLALLFMVVVFILITVLILRDQNEKSSPFTSILATFFILTIFTIFALYALDKYTKVAQLEHVVQKKVLINESFSIAGQIRNVGNFQIGKCILEVKISNDSIENTGTDSAIFVPKSVFGNLFKQDASATIDTTKEFTIAENLHKGEMRNFTVFMRYPPSYAKPSTRYELFCH